MLLFFGENLIRNIRRSQINKKSAPAAIFLWKNTNFAFSF
jgi:hypothetical protein